MRYPFIELSNRDDNGEHKMIIKRVKSLKRAPASKKQGFGFGSQGSQSASSYLTNANNRDVY